MAKRKSQVRKKSVKKSKSRNNRGKIRNPKTGRYVKKSGVIGKKLLAKSQKRKKVVKKSKTRRRKSVKKSRSRRHAQSSRMEVPPTHKRQESFGRETPRLGLFGVPPTLNRQKSFGRETPRLGLFSTDTNSTRISNKSFTKSK